MKKTQQAAILAGGFLGPFTGQSLAVILPQFADSFGITLGQAALTMSFYLFPFATLMLFSTWLVRRISPTKVVLTAYTVVLSAAVILTITPVWWLFLITFALAGSANAFTMPVLQIILKRTTPPEKLGSALGTYATMQSLGLLSAPLVSGLASVVNWRLTYVLVAVVALFIVVVQVPYLPAQPVDDGADTGRRFFSWAEIIHMLTCFAIGFGLIGMSFLVALHVGEAFGLGSVGRGLVVMCGGLGAFLLVRAVGRAADAAGARTVMLASLLGGVVMLVLLPVVPSVWFVALLWGGATLAAQGVQITVNLLVLRSPKGTTMISTVQAFRFFGSSATPVLLLPVYQGHVGWSFWVPALGLVAALALQATVGFAGRAGGKGGGEQAQSPA
ncbi:MFS transporter [Corynebacterium halotolerans]|uniref:Multidrug resistance protein n=1 Tax=Corynebacterium halotolerans YIM 70093 = DSM 44683 TaxID=1121362 RepID=M1NR19_9CORY|nr:MFS transporter [Corynebacterium halotolerans]AGF71962.1 multidrug resistance protein [Corynebacterium halotolerans YIM 70093 = DSM 44683]